MISLIKKETLFRDYSDILLIGVYTDKVSAVIARKEKGAIKIVAEAAEPQEGDSSGEEKLWLNCEKAIQKLPIECLMNIKNMAGVLGGGISELQLTVENRARKEPAEKISEQELADISLKDQNNFINIEEQFLVDGFTVESPIGIEGKEITARILTVGWDERLEKMMAALAASRNMRYLGSLDARWALIKSKNLLPKDCCVIFIFEKKTTICVIKNESVSAISNIDAGYGIITEQVSQKMSVGREEGKNIIMNYRDGKLESEASASVETTFKQSASNIINKIYGGLAGADKTSLLPGSVHIVISEQIPELKTALADIKWLAGLPMERNITMDVDLKIPGDTVTEQDEIGKSRYSFDRITLHYLNN